MVGSVAPDGAVKISFSPLSAASPDDSEWSSLPGYPETGIPDLDGPNTEMRVT